MTFFEILAAAIEDLKVHGFDSVERVDRWVEQLRGAARRQAGSGPAAETMVGDALAAIYRRLVEQGGVSRFNPGVARFTLERVKPKLRAELDRRIMASAQLIRSNREEAIEKTLRRFQGWATSIPVGGSDADPVRALKQEVAKPLRQLSHRERVVAIDQGHKLTASISEILARDTNAIACEWKSMWRQAGYAYRKDHKERDGKVYMLRGNWAQEKGLVKPGPAGYYEDVTSAGEEVFCRCKARWLMNLRSLPPEMLTDEGRATLAEARRKAAGLMLQAPAAAPQTTEQRVLANARSRDPEERVVVVDVERVDRAWRETPDYRIEPQEPGASHKLDRAKAFIQALAPDAPFDAPKLGVSEKSFGFDDGRHRFAAMRDLGFAAAPVAMDVRSVENARRRGWLVEP